MVKVEIIAVRGPLSLEALRHWWLDEHSPIARRMPGLRKYVINLAERDEAGGAPQIYGTDHLVFDSWEAAMAAYASPEWSEARAHTQATGITAERTWVTEHHVVPQPALPIASPAEAGGWREVPGVRMSELVYRDSGTCEAQQKSWLEEIAPLVRQAPELRGYLINLASRAEQDAEPLLCGTAEMLFESTEAAAAAYASPTWSRARALAAAGGARIVRSWCTTVAIL